jgi:hypothetical protein
LFSTICPCNSGDSSIWSPTHPFTMSSTSVIFYFFIININFLSYRNYLIIFKIHLVNMFLIVWERERECV